jgi:hypothetical protein
MQISRVTLAVPPVRPILQSMLIVPGADRRAPAVKETQ